MAIKEANFAFLATYTLFKDFPDSRLIRRRPLHDAIAKTTVAEPLIREEDLLPQFLSIMRERNIRFVKKDEGPYWIRNTSYNFLEIFGTCVQFLDQHQGPLPRAVLPPVNDVEMFISRVFQEQEKVGLDRQFEILLDITGNNVIGAANLGMIATRLMSRFADQRAYPSLIIKDKEITPHSHETDISKLINEWNEKIAKFEIYNTTGKNDGPGDSYYFWTHLFAASVFSKNSLDAKAFQKIFEQGTKIMKFIKKKRAGKRGTISEHHESSLLGRTIGLSLINMLF